MKTFLAKLLFPAVLMMSVSARADTPCWLPGSSAKPSADCEAKLKKDCEDKGGLWGGTNFGRGRIVGCNARTTDAGKPCEDSSQCEGGCVGENGSTAEGHCYEYKEFRGCGMIVKHEGQKQILCVD